MARATVSHGDSQATIEEGQRVRIGRSTVCDVQVGSGADGGPEDLGVSRTAATVSMQDGRLWVPPGGTMAQSVQAEALDPDERQLGRRRCALRCEADTQIGEKQGSEIHIRAGVVR